MKCVQGSAGSGEGSRASSAPPVSLLCPLPCVDWGLGARP